MSLTAGIYIKFSHCKGVRIQREGRVICFTYATSLKKRSVIMICIPISEFKLWSLIPCIYIVGADTRLTRLTYILKVTQCQHPLGIFRCFPLGPQKDKSSHYPVVDQC